MAEAFGILAAAVSCIDVADRLGRKIHRYSKTFINASTVVQDISRMIESRKVLLQAITDTPLTAKNVDYIPYEYRPELAKLLSEAYELLDELERLFEYTLTKPDSTSQSLKASKLSVANSYNKVCELFEAVNNTLRDVDLLWRAIERSHSIQNNISIGSIIRDSTSVKSDVSFIKQNLELIIKPVLAVQCETPLLDELAETDALVEHTEPQFSNQFMSYYNGSCVDWCSCRCHHLHRCLTAPGVTSFLGFLLISISAGKFSPLRCDNNKCERKQQFKLKVNFVFPPILLSWALYIVLTIQVSSRPRFAPRWTHICDSKSEIFRFAEIGDVVSLQRLLSQRKASPHDVAAGTGKTALHMAVVNNRQEACKLLIDAGADTGIEDNKKETPTEMAWSRILGRLIGGETANAFQSIFNVDTDFFDNCNYSIFHKLVFRERESHLRQHVEVDTTGIDDTDSSNRTALSWAASRGDSSLVKILLEAGASPHIAGSDGRLPLHWAALSKNPETMLELIKNGADVHAVCKMKREALTYAACNQNDVRYLDILLTAGCDINAQDLHDRTALGYACLHGRNDTVRHLLAHGANPQLAQNWGFCPLMEAVSAPHNEAVRLLITNPLRRPRFTGISIHGESLLHVLASHGNFETARIIGFDSLSILDINQRDNRGRRPLDILRDRLDVDHKLRNFFEELDTIVDRE